MNSHVQYMTPIDFRVIRKGQGHYDLYTESCGFWSITTTWWWCFENWNCILYIYECSSAIKEDCFLKEVILYLIPMSYKCFILTNNKITFGHIMLRLAVLLFSYCPLLFSAISIHIGFKSVITSAISFHYQKTS
jgi:hypothetical protein